MPDVSRKIHVCFPRDGVGKEIAYRFVFSCNCRFRSLFRLHVKFSVVGRKAMQMRSLTRSSMERKEDGCGDEESQRQVQDVPGGGNRMCSIHMGPANA